MAWLAAAAVVGAIGKHQANRSAKKAAQANAAFSEEQRRQQAIATRMEFAKFSRESDIFLGDQQSMMAKSGVDFSGSLLMQFAGDKLEVENEKKAILLTGAANNRSAQLRTQSYQKQADDYARIQPIQTLGSILNLASAGLEKKGE